MPRGGGVREGECSWAFHTGKPLRGFEEASQESKTGRKARSLVIEGKGQGLWPFPGPTPSRAEGKPSDPFPRNRDKVRVLRAWRGRKALRRRDPCSAPRARKRLAEGTKWALPLKVLCCTLQT